MAADDRRHNDFRDLVGVVTPDEFLESRSEAGLGFALEHKFSARFPLPLPPVDASDGPELDAGGQLGGGDQFGQFDRQVFGLHRRRDCHV